MLTNLHSFFTVENAIKPTVGYWPAVSGGGIRNLVPKTLLAPCDENRKVLLGGVIYDYNNDIHVSGGPPDKNAVPVRFTTTPPAKTPEGFPVHLRLLTSHDLDTILTCPLQRPNQVLAPSYREAVQNALRDPAMQHFLSIMHSYKAILGTDVFCPLEVLMPIKDSILNKKPFLNPKDDSQTMSVTVQLADGTHQSVPRYVLTALSAELILHVYNPSKLASVADVICFMNHISFLAEYGLRNTPLTETDVLLYYARVHNEFLFSKSIRALDGLVMNIGVDTHEDDRVNCLNEWVVRQNIANAENIKLLLVFAPIFVKKRNTWRAPSANILADIGLQALEDIENWFVICKDKVPFHNICLLRNHNYYNEDFFIRDNLGLECGVLPDAAPRLAELREAFYSSEQVRRHIVNPKEAFDALLQCNDGGLTLFKAKIQEIFTIPFARRAGIRP